MHGVGPCLANTTSSPASTIPETAARGFTTYVTRNSVSHPLRIPSAQKHGPILEKCQATPPRRARCCPPATNRPSADLGSCDAPHGQQAHAQRGVPRGSAIRGYVGALAGPGLPPMSDGDGARVRDRLFDERAWRRAWRSRGCGVHGLVASTLVHFTLQASTPKNPGARPQVARPGAQPVIPSIVALQGQASCAAADVPRRTTSSSPTSSLGVEWPLRLVTTRTG